MSIAFVQGIMKLPMYFFSRMIFCIFFSLSQSFRCCGYKSRCNLKNEIIIESKLFQATKMYHMAVPWLLFPLNWFSSHLTTTKKVFYLWSTNFFIFYLCTKGINFIISWYTLKTLNLQQNIPTITESKSTQTMTKIMLHNQTFIVDSNKYW